MMMIRKWIWSLLLLLTTASMSAQNAAHIRLDSLFDALSKGGRTMGSICISQNGKVLYSRTLGYSLIDGQHKIPATDKTKYRIASITKMFTATIICQLVQEDKIDFNTTLDTYFPKIPGAKTITIAQLLSHRSGIHNIYEDADFSSWKTTQKTPEEMVALISRNPQEFAADTKAAYSNSNYILLGYIIESICEKPYSEVVKERVITKAGLKNTYYGAKADPTKEESYSYAYNGDWIKQAEADMSILGGAGALISTPEDLNTFIQALFDKKLVKGRYLSKMQTMTDGFGMGMIAYPFGDKTLYGHHGGIDGFTSLLEFYPEDDLAVSFCSNGEAGAINDVVNAVLKIVFENPLEN
jgi:D-alanyl-D-alanine carboxypeptidase